MKVLIVNKFLYPNGGSETYIFKIGQQLLKLGHEVQYFGMEHEGRIVGNHAESYTSDMDFHSSKLKKLLYPFSIIYSREARKKIRIVLEDFNPDVVHVNNFNFQLTPSVLYEIRKYEKDRGHRVKLIYTAHDSQLVCPNHLMQPYHSKDRCTECIGGSPWNCARKKCIHGSRIKSVIGSLEAAIYRKKKTYGLFDAVICPSSFLKEKLDTLDEIKNKTIVLRNFIDVTEVDVTDIDVTDVDVTEVGPDSDSGDVTGKYMAYIGRYSEEKGIATLLKVCKRLPEIHFVFAGNGPLEGEVAKVANIENRGFLTGNELHRLIKNARAVVFPSECNENCPFTVMEALSKGVPVIGSSIGGVPELIEDNLNGKLFKAGDEDQLEELINSIWKDDALRKRLKMGAEATGFDTLEEYTAKLVQLSLSSET